MVRVFTRNRKETPTKLIQNLKLMKYPNLYGQLRLIAQQNGKNVYEIQVDFDTLDLLIERFNSKKNYSPLSKVVFDVFLIESVRSQFIELLKITKR